MAELGECFAEMRRETGGAHSGPGPTASVREPSVQSVAPAKRDDDACGRLIVPVYGKLMTET